ncbi:MGMT family protein [Maridesulfovibrio hydrothermalis]|uniref:Methylated-DNA-(Protein)-cysteine S-methyltransferase DNA binding n=1 Tax=Maridesulfovibrio hydrothermalis AM13 = DSM 14728 TaxID=1121451 RepID=L0RBA4_9BACT|nr:MGMT family protein [Maridesulfovibrio hydrothermalis]CCO23497.1 Methylated-DNA-(Protein)-cysteine S-methyltransferase DNA binding [Maridesulfovibrio hydrothermalis AM13 = DSM 14728]
MAIQIFTARVIDITGSIPKGKVTTYGGVAAMAGNPRAARQVARILHTCSEKEDLPWHRVINQKGRISLKRGQGYEEQRGLLELEGVVFDLSGRVDFDEFLWIP